MRTPWRPARTSFSRRTALAAWLAFVICSCGGGTPPASVPLSPVVGIVIDVQARPGLEVDRFVLGTGDGARIDFKVGRLDLSPPGFPAAHLREHLAASLPVKVTFHAEGSTLVATRLEDA